MASESLDEIRQFYSFLSEKLEAKEFALSPEEALDEWRRGNPQEQASEEDVAAIREAIEDMAKGDRGVPFAEFDREFRRRNGLSV